MNVLRNLFNKIQLSFPVLNENFLKAGIRSLSDRDQRFIMVVESLDINQDIMWPYERAAREGRPKASRRSILFAFIAKAVYGFPTTKLLIDFFKSSLRIRTLCGWNSISEIPDESTFSRAFAEFAEGGLLQKIHEMLISKGLGDQFVFHCSTDATAIKAREKVAKQQSIPEESKPSKKKGRPKKGEPAREPEPTKLEIQSKRDLKSNLADLPTLCDVGTKVNSQGY